MADKAMAEAMAERKAENQQKIRVSAKEIHAYAGDRGLQQLVAEYELLPRESKTHLIRTARALNTDEMTPRQLSYFRRRSRSKNLGEPFRKPPKKPTPVGEFIAEEKARRRSATPSSRGRAPSRKPARGQSRSPSRSPSRSRGKGSRSKGVRSKESTQQKGAQSRQAQAPQAPRRSLRLRGEKR